MANIRELQLKSTNGELAIIDDYRLQSTYDIILLSYLYEVINGGRRVTVCRYSIYIQYAKTEFNKIAQLTTLQLYCIILLYSNKIFMVLLYMIMLWHSGPPQDWFWISGARLF